MKETARTLFQVSYISIFGEWAFQVLKALQIGFSGTGLLQRVDYAKRFVHLDTKPRKALYSY